MRNWAMAVVTALSIAAVGSALNVWRQQATMAADIEDSASQALLHEELAKRDIAFGQALNAIGEKLGRVETKLDLLMDDRRRGGRQ